MKFDDLKVGGWYLTTDMSARRIGAIKKFFNVISKTDTKARAIVFAYDDFDRSFEYSLEPQGLTKGDEEKEIPAQEVDEEGKIGLIRLIFYAKNIKEKQV